MIPAGHITRWAKNAPWPTREQVEQDLVLSRLIVEIANHPLLGEELVFRGGTCLHKLHLPTPRRYSEDLDYVRVTSSGIGPVLDALREVAACFAPYRPEGYDRVAAEATLAEHVAHAGFRGDLAALTEVPGDYDIDTAAALITTELLARL